MPYVNIKVAGEISKEEKKALAVGVAELLEKVLNKPKSATYTVIDEVSPDNWAKGDETIAEIRAKN